MKLVPLEHKHFPKLFEITSITEPWYGFDRNTCDRLFSQREGFVLENKGGEVIGHITVSDYIPLLEAIIHASVLPEYKSRWLTKSIYKRVFDFVFNDLECRRAVGRAFAGYTDLHFHQRLGFTLEGILRDGLLIRGQYSDILIYSMLPSERRW